MRNMNVQQGQIVSTWRGKPLDQYSKQELIEIVIELGQMQQQESHEHSRQLDVLSGLLKATPIKQEEQDNV